MTDLKSITIHFYENQVNINLENIPTLDVKNRVGFTGYIDYIRCNEVTFPIMKGIDCLNRPFVVIKTYINDQIFMDTIFSRHTDQYSLWHSCGNHSYQILGTTGGMDVKQALLVKSLVENGEGMLEEGHRVFPEYIGKKLNLYDEKKWNAAKIIQNQFRKCRYNPEYQMCKNVQIKNLSNIFIQNNMILK